MSAPPSTPRHQPQPASSAAEAQAIIAYLSREHSGLMGPSTQIMKTEATKLFCLTPRDLEGVPCTKVPKANPLWRKTHMYEVKLLALACVRKYRSLEKLKEKKAKNKAAAAKRKATKRGESNEERNVDPRAQALLSSLGLKGVKRINKSWARDLFRLTPADLKAIPFEEASNHFKGYRPQHMYEVSALVAACLGKYGDLEGLKAKKAAKPIKTQRSSYEPYEPPPEPIFASSGRCCPWPNCMCEAFEEQNADWY